MGRQDSVVTYCPAYRLATKPTPKAKRPNQTNAQKEHSHDYSGFDSNKSYTSKDGLKPTL